MRAEILYNIVHQCVEESASVTIGGLNNVDERDMQGSDTKQEPVEAPGHRTLPVSFIFQL